MNVTKFWKINFTKIWKAKFTAYNLPDHAETHDAIHPQMGQ